LPEAKIRVVDTVSKHPKKRAVKDIKKVAAEETKKPTTELQKLEDELSDIEGKLGGLR